MLKNTKGRAYNLLQISFDNKGFNTNILTTPKILFIQIKNPLSLESGRMLATVIKLDRKAARLIRRVALLADIRPKKDRGRHIYI